MGSVRIQVYNQQLMDGYTYSKISHLKALLKNMDGLERLSAKGDQVACSILIDLKTCLGEYGMDKTCLTERQIYVIKQNLIVGVPQTKIAELLDVRQNWVSGILNQGLKRMRKQLVCGHVVKQEVGDSGGRGLDGKMVSRE